MPYVDTHAMTVAFLAHRLDRLADLIVGQGEQLLRGAGLEMPSRTLSLFLLIGEEGPLSAADVVLRLEQPHQLVTQRVEVLMDLGLIERAGHPSDGRRKLLKLSAKGRTQHAALAQCLSRAAVGFQNLFEEIGCDLSLITTKANEALQRRPLIDRADTKLEPAITGHLSRQGHV